MYGDYPKEDIVEMEQDGSDSTWLETTHWGWHPPVDN
jgi:hypothetical protein